MADDNNVKLGVGVDVQGEDTLSALRHQIKSLQDEADKLTRSAKSARIDSKVQTQLQTELSAAYQNVGKSLRGLAQPTKELRTKYRDLAREGELTAATFKGVNDRMKQALVSLRSGVQLSGKELGRLNTILAESTAATGALTKAGEKRKALLSRVAGLTAKLASEEAKLQAVQSKTAAEAEKTARTKLRSANAEIGAQARVSLETEKTKRAVINANKAIGRSETELEIERGRNQRAAEVKARHQDKRYDSEASRKRRAERQAEMRRNARLANSQRVEALQDDLRRFQGRQGANPALRNASARQAGLEALTRLGRRTAAAKRLYDYEIKRIKDREALTGKYDAQAEARALRRLALNNKSARAEYLGQIETAKLRQRESDEADRRRNARIANGQRVEAMRGDLRRFQGRQMVGLAYAGSVVEKAGAKALQQLDRRTAAAKRLYDYEVGRIEAREALTGQYDAQAEARALRRLSQNQKAARAEYAAQMRVAKMEQLRFDRAERARLKEEREQERAAIRARTDAERGISGGINRLGSGANRIQHAAIQPAIMAAGAAAATAAAVRQGVREHTTIDTAEANMRIFGQGADKTRAGMTQDEVRDIRHTWSGKMSIDRAMAESTVLNALTETMKGGIDDVGSAKVVTEDIIRNKNVLEMPLKETTDLASTLWTINRGKSNEERTANIRDTMYGMAIAARETRANGSELVEAMNRSAGVSGRTGMSDAERAAFNAASISSGMQRGKAGTFLDFLTGDIMGYKKLDPHRQKNLNEGLRRVGMGGSASMAQKLSGPDAADHLAEMFDRLATKKPKERAEISTLIGMREWRGEFEQQSRGNEAFRRSLKEQREKERNGNWVAEAEADRLKTWERSMERMRAIFSQAWDAFGEGFEEVFRAVTDFATSTALKTDFGSITRGVEAFLGGMKEAFGVSTWKELIDNAFGGMSSQDVMKSLRDFGRGVGEGLTWLANLLKSSAKMLGLTNGSDSAQATGRLITQVIGLSAALLLISPLLSVFGLLSVGITMLAGALGLARGAGSLMSLGLGAAGMGAGAGAAAGGGLRALMMGSLAGAGVLSIAAIIGSMRGEIATLVIDGIKAMFKAMADAVSQIDIGGLFTRELLYKFLGVLDPNLERGARKLEKVPEMIPPRRENESWLGWLGRQTFGIGDDGPAASTGTAPSAPPHGSSAPVVIVPPVTRAPDQTKPQTSRDVIDDLNRQLQNLNDSLERQNLRPIERSDRQAPAPGRDRLGMVPDRSVRQLASAVKEMRAMVQFASMGSSEGRFRPFASTDGFGGGRFNGLGHAGHAGSASGTPSIGVPPALEAWRNGSAPGGIMGWSKPGERFTNEGGGGRSFGRYNTGPVGVGAPDPSTSPGQGAPGRGFGRYNTAPVGVGAPDPAAVAGPGGRTGDRMRQVYQAYRNAGLNHGAAKSFAAEIGRENGYRDDILFGTHIDPKNGALNAGMMSWQKDRATNLMNRLREKGLVGPDGKIQRSQAALDEMAKFSIDEMKSGALGARGKRALDVLNDPNSTHAQRALTLGDDVIKWRQHDPAYAHHKGIRDRYYAQLGGLTDGANGGGGAPAQAQGTGTGPQPTVNFGERLAQLKTSGAITNAQCVSLAKAWVGSAGSVLDWRKGDAVTDGDIKPGTPIATFLNRDGSQSNRYAGGGTGTPGANLDHAGVFHSYITGKDGKRVGMKMLDQWNGPTGQPQLRDYYFGDRRGGEKDARNYFAVKSSNGAYLGGDRNPMASKAAEIPSGIKANADAAKSPAVQTDSKPIAAEANPGQDRSPSAPKAADIPSTIKANAEAVRSPTVQVEGKPQTGDANSGGDRTPMSAKVMEIPSVMKTSADAAKGSDAARILPERPAVEPASGRADGAQRGRARQAPQDFPGMPPEVMAMLPPELRKIMPQVMGRAGETRGQSMAPGLPPQIAAMLPPELRKAMSATMDRPAMMAGQAMVPGLPRGLDGILGALANGLGSGRGPMGMVPRLIDTLNRDVAMTAKARDVEDRPSTPKVATPPVTTGPVAISKLPAVDPDRLRTGLPGLKDLLPPQKEAAPGTDPKPMGKPMGQDWYDDGSPLSLRTAGNRRMSPAEMTSNVPLDPVRTAAPAKQGVGGGSGGGGGGGGGSTPQIIIQGHNMDPEQIANAVQRRMAESHERRTHDLEHNWG